MAVEITDPPRLRETAMKRRDGAWDFDAILNKELYPALKGLRDWVIGTVTTIITVLNRFEPVFLTGASNAITGEYEAKSLFVNHGSATTLTFDVSASDEYELGACIVVVQQGAGQVTISATGITIEKAETLKTRKQWAPLMLLKFTSTQWLCGGDAELA